jgi:hypothetical protein
MQAVTHLALGTTRAAAAWRPVGNGGPGASLATRYGDRRDRISQDWLIAEEEKLASGGDRRQGIHRGGKG